MRGARPERALESVVRGVLRFDRGVSICVACSGGPDSIALAAIVDRLARPAGIDVTFAHVNHGVRAGAAQDECVVLSAGARLGRRVLIARPRIERDDEATLREARYAALAEIARAAGVPQVATAHTAEDQTETVLLALFRGTGLAGLAGIPERRALCDGIDLVRPVLRLTHAELATELRRSGLPYAIDPSNAERRYRRNALREPLDRLRDEFPHLDRAVARCAAIVRGEIEGTDRARSRHALREGLRAQDALRDVPFERIEAAIEAASRGKAVPQREPAEDEG